MGRGSISNERTFPVGCSTLPFLLPPPFLLQIHSLPVPAQYSTSPRLHSPLLSFHYIVSYPALPTGTFSPSPPFLINRSNHPCHYPLLLNYLPFASSTIDHYAMSEAQMKFLLGSVKVDVEMELLVCTCLRGSIHDFVNAFEVGFDLLFMIRSVSCSCLTLRVYRYLSSFPYCISRVLESLDKQDRYYCVDLILAMIFD